MAPAAEGYPASAIADGLHDVTLSSSSSSHGGAPHASRDSSASTLESASSDTSPAVCRLCLGEEDTAHQPLITACAGCKGTIASIHLECLQQWRRVLWSQGQYVRAQRCDICLQPWDAQQCRQGGASGGAVTWWQQVALQLCRSPELAFKAWRCCILAGGLAAGTHHGMSGLGAGVNTGLKLARPLAWLTLRLMPQFSVAAAVAPSLAPLLREALRCSCCVMLTEVLLTSLAGLFGGGLVGFCLGTVGVVRLSAKAGYAVGTVAARAAWPKALLLALARSPQAKQLAAALLACSRRKGSLQG